MNKYKSLTPTAGERLLKLRRYIEEDQKKETEPPKLMLRPGSIMPEYREISYLEAERLLKKIDELLQKVHH